MNNSPLPFWYIVIGLIAAALVIASIALWTQGQISQIAPLKERLAQQDRELAVLKSRPVEIREVVKEITKEVVVEIEKECGKPAPVIAEPKQSRPPLQEITLRVPRAILKIECREIEIGAWAVPAVCKERLKTLEGKFDRERHFLAVTPVIDSRRYPGPLNELKQAGLAQFRSTAAADTLKSQLGKNLLIFHRRPVQTDDARGFNVELFAQE